MALLIAKTGLLVRTLARLYKHTVRQMTHAAIRMHYLQIQHIIVMKIPTGLRSSYDCICGRDRKSVVQVSIR